MVKKLLFGAVCLILILGFSFPARAVGLQGYSSKQFKFGFKYPLDWSFYQPTDAAIYQRDYLQKSASGTGVSNVLASVGLPANSYPKTDFSEAYAVVAASDAVASANACRLYISDTSRGLIPLPYKRKINGIAFFWGTSGGSASGSPLNTRVYHTFHNRICYEISLNLVYASGAGFVHRTKKSVNQYDVFNRLETVLKTFSFGK